MTIRSFDEVWPSLETLSRQVHKVLADGCRNANRIRQEHPEIATDTLLWAGNVRGYAVRQLGAEVREEGFRLDIGFNLSATLRGNNMSIRVLKAPDGKMPRADSIGRKRFFNQNLPLPFDQAELDQITDAPEHAPNFVYKWTSDEKGQLCGLDLGHPKPLDENATPESEHEWFWVESIFVRTMPTIDSQDELFEIEDIPGMEIDYPEEDVDGDGTGTDGE